MKILIVDDSKAMRMIVGRTLRQAGFTGHDVSEASNGVEALEKIRTESPDLVLSDWNMPEMNGIELLGNVREEGLKTRFGFITSESSEATLHTATEAGAEFVITKPFNADTMLMKLAPIFA